MQSSLDDNRCISLDWARYQVEDVPGCNPVSENKLPDAQELERKRCKSRERIWRAREGCSTLSIRINKSFMASNVSQIKPANDCS